LNSPKSRERKKRTKNELTEELFVKKKGVRDYKGGRKKVDATLEKGSSVGKTTVF